jgi:hypothetical protein
VIYETDTGIHRPYLDPALSTAGPTGVIELAFPDLSEEEPLRNPVFISVWQALLLLVIVFTVSLYVRSRTLTMHQIQASLALIEEHLRKMSQKD